MKHLITMTMGRVKTIVLLFIAATLFGCIVAPYPGPPPLMLDRSPSVVHIPGSYVYLAPGLSVDVLFYSDYWYRRHNNYWYRASRYDGVWTKVRRRHVPSRVHRLPRDYHRHVKPDAHRIPHRELKKSWKRWERERYWDRKELKKRKTHEKKRRR